MPTTARLSYHLVIDQTSYLQQTRRLLVDRSGYAVARVRRRETAHGLELLLDNWTYQESSPTGRVLPPLVDWAVLHCKDDIISSPSDLASDAAPKRSHLLIAINLDPDDLDRTPVLIHQGNQSFLPETLRYVGPGLLTLPTNQQDLSLHPIDLLRSSRTRGALGDELFDRLRHFSVAIVGAGRGGQELARHLVAAGVRRFTFIDGDTVQPENLDAMPLTGVLDVGTAKVKVLADSLLRNNHDLAISAVSSSVLAPGSIEVLRGRRYDTVFTFVDNDAARLAVSRICAETMTVHMDVGTLIERSESNERNMAADIRLFQPGRGCVACVPAMENMEDVLYELAAPAGCLKRGERVTWDQQRAGSLLHLNSLASSQTVETWLSYLTGSITDSYWLSIDWPSGKSPWFDPSLVGATTACPFCPTEKE